MVVILYQQAGLQNLFVGPVWFRCMSKRYSLHLEPLQLEEGCDSDTCDIMRYCIPLLIGGNVHINKLSISVEYKGLIG